jgi:hypothetical protein
LVACDVGRSRQRMPMPENTNMCFECRGTKTRRTKEGTHLCAPGWRYHGHGCRRYTQRLGWCLGRRESQQATVGLLGLQRSSA